MFIIVLKLIIVEKATIRLYDYKHATVDVFYNC